MTIDIERLIEDIDEDDSGEIEFNEFKQLLTNWFTFTLEIINEKNSLGWESNELETEIVSTLDFKRAILNIEYKSEHNNVRTDFERQ